MFTGAPSGYRGSVTGGNMLRGGEAACAQAEESATAPAARARRSRFMRASSLETRAEKQDRVHACAPAAAVEPLRLPLHRPLDGGAHAAQGSGAGGTSRP